METFQTLSDALHILYLKTSEKIIEARNQGLLNCVPYERIPAADIVSSPGSEGFRYDFPNTEYFDQYNWSSEVFVRFLDEQIEVLPEYGNAADELCRAFEVTEEQKPFVISIGLNGFIKFLMHRIPNGGVNAENINKYIRIFINDCRTQKGDQKYTWHIRTWLGSLHFDSDCIQMGNVMLRKHNEQDLVLVRPRSHQIEEIEKFTSRGLLAPAILEFSMIAEKQVMGLYSDDIKHQIENCIDVLRLFKVGNITLNGLSVSPVSILEYSHSESLDLPFDSAWKDKVDHQYTSRYEYLITKAEEPLLIAFFEKMKPILEGISPKNYLSGNYHDMAFHRYKDALLRSEVSVNRMISAITCLEALLSDSGSEITYKISIHVAGLLRFYGFNSIKIFEKMKQAYKVRSTLVHGSNLSNKLLDFSKNHTHEIVNYARLCLLTSLQLKGHCTKDALIKKLDHAFIDDTARADLASLLAQHVTIPVLYPFFSMKDPAGDDVAVPGFPAQLVP